MNNPAQMMQQQVMQKMQQSNPQVFSKVQEMISGKSESELKQMVTNVAKERGIDLNQFASQFGIKL